MRSDGNRANVEIALLEPCHRSPRGYCRYLLGGSRSKTRAVSMHPKKEQLRAFALALVACAALASCTSSTTASGPSSTPPSANSSTSSPDSPSPSSACANESPAPIEPPVPIESNPPGDIPDTIQYPTYAPKGASFSVIHPEGWARRIGPGSKVSFTENLFSMSVSWSSATAAPTVVAAKATDVPRLQCTEPAFRLESVQPVKLPAGSSVVIRFQANSAPNSVTGKQSRLEVFRYEL